LKYDQLILLQLLLKYVVVLAAPAPALAPEIGIIMNDLAELFVTAKITNQKSIKHYFV